MLKDKRGELRPELAPWHSKTESESEEQQEQQERLDSHFSDLAIYHEEIAIDK